MHWGVLGGLPVCDQGRSKGGAWGGLSPPKILVQHIIYNSIHVDVIVRAVPQIEHIPLLQAARKFRTRKCGQPLINPRCIVLRDHEY